MQPELLVLHFISFSVETSDARLTEQVLQIVVQKQLPTRSDASEPEQFHRLLQFRSPL